MTIRLKLTLVYSLILTLVVVVFSILLYSFQSQATLNIVERNLERDHSRTAEFGLWERDGERPPPPDSVKRDFERSFIQVRDLADTVVHKSGNLGEAILPLSEAGYQAVVQGQVWMEKVTLDEELLLIRSQMHETAQGEAMIAQAALPVGDQLEYLSQLRNTLIIGDLIVIVVAFGAGWTLAGLTLRPIHRITQTAKAVGEERDFSQRVEHTGPNDEVGQLATTFNSMLAQLQEAYVQVEYALQAQRRFVADASHELRTPLTTIRGNLALLQREPPIDTEDQEDVIADVVGETERLIRLVNDLLLLARADTQQRLQTERVTIQPLLEDVCRQARLLDPERTIVCRPEVDATVIGNADALKQILLVLLDNAVRHTPQEATVTVSSTSNNGCVAVRVHDNGPGIDAAYLPHIFERFYRGDVVRTGSGIGLGLSIASELTKALGGTIAVESMVGEGSVFTMSFHSPKMN